METKAPMRPVISKLLEHNGKTYLLPVPARYRELLECVQVLGIKDVEDEEDMRIVEYRSLIGVAPDYYYNWQLVDEIAECLSRMTPGQLEAIKMLCKEFDLEFVFIDCFFDFLAAAKSTTIQEIRKKGIPITSSEGGSY
jgi:hypothetical protein